MKWHGAWLYGVHTTHWDGSSHVTTKQRCKYTTSVELYIVTHSEWHASAVSVVESGEQRYTKAITNCCPPWEAFRWPATARCQPPPSCPWQSPPFAPRGRPVSRVHPSPPCRRLLSSPPATTTLVISRVIITVITFFISSSSPTVGRCVVSCFCFARVKKHYYEHTHFDIRLRS